jgi:hypothetical protein
MTFVASIIPQYGSHVNDDEVGVLLIGVFQPAGGGGLAEGVSMP